MALAKLTCLRRVRFVFVVVALLFVVSNVRSLAGRAFGPPAFRPAAAAFQGRGVGPKVASAESRGAQSAWVRGGGSARASASARRLVAAFNRSFFEASEQSSLSSTDVAWGVDEDYDDGQPEGSFVDAELDAPLPGRAPVWPSLPPLLTEWARVEASDAPPDPFCPPIQRPPIGLAPCHKRGRGVFLVGIAEKGEPRRRWG